MNVSDALSYTVFIVWDVWFIRLVHAEEIHTNITLLGSYSEPDTVQEMFAVSPSVRFLTPLRVIFTSTVRIFNKSNQKLQ